MGGRLPRSTDYFSAHDSNTICDVTGFKVKKSEVMRRWEGFYVISDAWHPRQPQDFPVTAVPQKVHKNVRIDPVNVDGQAVPSFTPI